MNELAKLVSELFLGRCRFIDSCKEDGLYSPDSLTCNCKRGKYYEHGESYAGCFIKKSKE